MTPISVLFLCARSLCLTNPEEFSVHCFKWRHKHVRLLIWRRLYKKKINSVMLRQYIISFFQAVFRSCCFLINEVCKTALWFSDQVAKPASCSLSCFFSANTTFSSFVLAVPKFFPRHLPSLLLELRHHPPAVSEVISSFHHLVKNCWSFSHICISHIYCVTPGQDLCH